MTWDVEYGTTFEKIEELRNMMIEFVEHEKVHRFCYRSVPTPGPCH